MSSEWIAYVKQVQKETGTSYKDALKEASKRKKGGATWKLSPAQQKQYVEDTSKGVNLVTKNGATFWQPPK